MQRVGATSVWTGDVPVSWEAIQNTPQYMLDWSLAGASYVLCDAGGFSGGQAPPALLVRWYQVSALMPVMFTHSAHQLPHWPFLYGEEAGNAMRKALSLRYSLIPLLYSLAHEQSARGAPVTRPMAMHFAHDPATAALATQWLLGDSLLVAPCLTGSSNTSDNRTSVYLPSGSHWFVFNDTDVTLHAGPTTLQLANVALDAIPMFVKAGAIIPLAPSTIQYSDQLPGGSLRLHIYAGGDANFTLVEDDGITLGYEQEDEGGVAGGGGVGAAAVRRTLFRWSDATKTLSWDVAGSFADAHIFVEMDALLFEPAGVAHSATRLALGRGGRYAF